MSNYKVTLPDGTVVEGPDMVKTAHLAQTFDERRIAEGLGVIADYQAHSIGEGENPFVETE
jgi:hypothetical protein